MPTETEFEQARARFEAAAEETDQALVPVRQANGRDVLTGGRLTTDVDDFIDTTGAELDGVATELRQLATVCATRAEECRQAEAALTAYLNDLEEYRQAEAEHRQQGIPGPGEQGGGAPSPVDRGSAPTPPPAPPDYVEFEDGLAEALASVSDAGPAAAR